MPKRAPTLGDGKRSPLNMRTTKDLREKLEKAAGKSGRSLVQEVEARLEQSLNGDFLLTELLGSGKNAHLLKVVAMLLSGLDQAAYPWYSNPASAARLRSDIERAMSAVANAGTWEEAVGALHPSSSFEQRSGTVGMLEMPIADQQATTIKSRKKRNSK
jgi:TraY domain